MNTNNAAAVDPFLALAWSLGHAILTALVGHTPVNAAVTYDHIRMELGRRVPHRWVGGCKKCHKGHRVDGMLAMGRDGNRTDTVIVSGTTLYMAGCNGTDPTMLSVACCGGRVKLTRVYDSHKPGKPRHECNAKCIASKGPACECKCGGKNHGSGH